MPGRGQGPQQQGRLCVQLPPVHRPHRGSPPHNYSIRHKITEQGGSLPAPFLATLPELPTAPPPDTAPQTLLAQDPQPQPQGCSRSLSPSGTSLRPQLLGSQHPVPAPPHPPAMGSLRLRGEVKVLPLLPARREPLHCPPAQEGVSPKVTLHPSADSQHHSLLVQTVWGQRSPFWVLLPPNTAVSHSAQGSHLTATPPGMTARDNPLCPSRAGGGQAPRESCPQVPTGEGQRAQTVLGGQLVRAGCQPHSELSPPGKEKGAGGKGGHGRCWGVTERHKCPPRRCRLLQGPLCVSPEQVEAMVNSNATAPQVGPCSCHHLGDPGGTKCQGGSTPGYVSAWPPKNRHCPQAWDNRMW